MSKVPRTQLEQLKPVWLFFDDFLRLADLLRRYGVVEISTPGRIVRIPEERRPTDINVDEALWQRCEEVYQTRPVRWLCLLVYEMGTWIVLLPRQAQVGHARDWGPGILEMAWFDEVRGFIRARRHPLWFLGERGWQLGVVLVASALFLPVVVVSILRGAASDILRILSFPGLVVWAIMMVTALAGRFIPSRSRVTLWRWTRQEFAQRMQTIAYYVIGGGGALLLSSFIGSRGLFSGHILLLLFGLVIFVAAIIWGFGFLVGRVR